MTWKEQFDKEFEGHIIMEDTALRNWIHQVIKKKVIEKLIADIPGVIFDTQGGAETAELKQQLRDKWL